MSSKTYQLDHIGLVSVYKRRGTKRVNLRVSSDLVKVIQPVWLPYGTGLQFASKHSAWILEQRQKIPVFNIVDGLRIGKLHSFRIIEYSRLRTRVNNNYIDLFLPKNIDLTDNAVKLRAKTAIKRALKIEASDILGLRLASIAGQHGFVYGDVKYKSMKSRWGSCNSHKTITLNIYLMMLPWELIDYVIIHELAHTKHLHHGKSFWVSIEEILPDYKNRRALLKKTQQSIYIFQ